MFLSTNVDKKPLLKTVENVAKAVFDDPADAFYTGRAMDLMFNGVSINCGGEDKTAAGFCMQVEDEIPFKRIDDDHLTFSLFGGVSYNDPKILRQKKNNIFKKINTIDTFVLRLMPPTWVKTKCTVVKRTIRMWVVLFRITVKRVKK